MAPFEALYRRKYQSPLCWLEGENRAIFGPQLVDETTEKIKVIRERLQIAQNRQKKYYDARHKKMKFSMIGAVAYRLALPPHLEGIHDVFHISMLKRYVPDPSHVIQYNPERMEMRSDLSYKEKPVRILAKDVKRFRNKEIPMVKVLWSNQTEREATWEVEDEMMKSYPELFTEISRTKFLKVGRIVTSR
ncbi:hypothetical protein AXF42_Ash019985 [Apostasia shenzhenica]|uniref:Tf2-1-like SH3-like domain-containing protein n=1 Tax=Apostasia shenzhenica TaxID=1088818 RepID=A0A2I0AZP4_9ASPA|nr:hypothetical protein AXF42_Ash019985 [Apostasia shenzhenica]